MNNAIWPEGHYIDNHFILFIHVEYKSGLPRSSTLLHEMMALPLSIKWACASSIFLYYYKPWLPASFNRAAEMTFTPWVILLRVPILGMNSWHSSLIPSTMSQHSRNCGGMGNVTTLDVAKLQLLLLKLTWPMTKNCIDIVQSIDTKLPSSRTRLLNKE